MMSGFLERGGIVQQVLGFRPNLQRVSKIVVEEEEVIGQWQDVKKLDTKRVTLSITIVLLLSKQRKKELKKNICP